MKTLLIAIVLGCGAMLPVVHAQSSTDAQTELFAKKKYPITGSFKLRFDTSSITKTVGTKITKVKKVAGFPSYKKGKKGSFKISASGALLINGTNISIPYNSVNGNVVKYLKTDTSGFKTTLYTADIETNAKGKPKRGVISLTVNDYSPSGQSTIFATYEFN